MHPIFKDLVKGINFKNDLQSDIHSFLTMNNYRHTAEHCMEVGAEAGKIARQFNVNAEAAQAAGWLHDISAVFPSQERIAVSKQLGIDILPEEEIFPLIIHQKISKVMANDIFGVTDKQILDAVGCHTTLRANSTMLDQVLFVADKIAWDQTGEPPYIYELKESLKLSLKHAAFCYIQYLWNRKETLKVVHPWLREAYEELLLQID
jgi:predicted HD superfamily hydrolase involved in NAD metabolism